MTTHTELDHMECVHVVQTARRTQPVAYITMGTPIPLLHAALNFSYSVTDR